MQRNSFARKKPWARYKNSLLRYSNQRANKNILKARWIGLFFLSTVTFILLSNSNSVRLQSNAIATEINPQTFNREIKPISTATTPSFAIADVAPQQTVAILPKHPFELQTIDTQKDPLNTRQTWIIRAGDTLTHILQRFDVHDAYGDILSMGRASKPLVYLRSGKRMHLDIFDGKLQKITYEKTRVEHFVLQRTDDGDFIAKKHQLVPEKHLKTSSGIIQSSFYKAGLKAGLDDSIIIQMAHILGWDIDFALDIRKGDFFSVVYEEEILDGIKIGYGKILGVTLVNRGKTFRAIHYVDKKGREGHYSPDGKNIKKPFLRAPLDFTRVSSKFSLKRLHPILKINRPHRGVDYAAPHGTPIFTTADGRVTYKGWKAGYGNVVMLHHFNKYTTVYAHLSRFKRGLRVGSTVKQKDIVGYVGMTGYATGPHLHYEIRQNGKHKNPLTIKLPDSKPLPKAELARFKESAQAVLVKLRDLEKSYAAK